ncbi:MAG: IS1595 family transposase [Alphaproteobacteria bacterium]
MARNPVQFQKGLSLAEFNVRYGTEEKCHAALFQMRWPDGFVCPKCGKRKYSYSAARRVFQCSDCRAQTTVKAGTILHKSRTPLTKWFLAIYLLTQSKNDIAALELSRQLGVKWDTAWLIKQKLMEAMRQRNHIYKLAGEVQIDDAYLGGEKQGKPGRGAANKTPFVIAVQTRENKPHYTQLRRVAGFTSAEIKSYAAANIAPGSRVTSDGLACFAAVTEAGLEHRAIVTGGGRPTAPELNWVNTGLGNIKCAITGTCRSCSPQHTDRYLAAYEYRFNRRFQLDKMVERLAATAMRTKPKPYKAFILAETSG